MAVFIDTGVFVAVRNKEDVNHTRAKQLLKQALKGQYGRMFTSDYIIDEAITTALARTHNLDIAKRTGAFIIDSPRIIKLHVREDEFNSAWNSFKVLTRPLSFTDEVTLTLVAAHGIDRVMSFDSDFDGLVDRVQ